MRSDLAFQPLLTGLLSILSLVALAASARADADPAEPFDDSEAEPPSPPRQPSAYSLRLETGVGVGGAQASLALDVYPVRWLSIGAYGGGMGQWWILTEGHAYGGGLSVGPRFAIPFGYFIANLHGGIAQFKWTQPGTCSFLWRDSGSSNYCEHGPSQSGTGALVGFSVGAVFKVGQIQMGPLLRFDHVSELNVLTVNVALTLPRS